jgi:methanol--5-hydroxybenzimidazolylcobamide Co-methyltransferase
MATTICLEQLEYDVRLMNRAARHSPGVHRMFQMLTVDSDVAFDPQAVVLAPDVVIDIASRIVAGKNPIDAAKRGALRAIQILDERARSGALLLSERETVYFERMREDLAGIPEDESRFVEMMLPALDPGKVILKEYGL